jgi:hypothetical protein
MFCDGVYREWWGDKETILGDGLKWYQVLFVLNSRDSRWSA